MSRSGSGLSDCWCEKSWLMRIRSSFGTPFLFRPRRRLMAVHRPHPQEQRHPPDQVTFCVQGVISPLLANIYLHYVYDLWADQWRKRTATGSMIVIRYADDTIVGFQRHADADRFLRDLRARLASFSLDLHPDKTRLIEFGRFAAQRRSARGLPKPETFDFLGFTHICARAGDGRFLLVRHTM